MTIYVKPAGGNKTPMSGPQLAQLAVDLGVDARTNFAELDDKNTVDLPSVNVPLANALNNLLSKTASASKAEAEAGADNTKWMTALRTAQAIAALAPAGGGAPLQTGPLVSDPAKAPNAEAVANAIAGVTAGAVAPVDTVWDPSNIQLDLVQSREAGRVDLTEDTTVVIGAGAVINGSYNVTVGGNFTLDTSAFVNGNGFTYSKTKWNNLVFIQRADAAYVFGATGGTYTAPVILVLNDTFDTDGPLGAGWAASGSATISVVGGKAVIPGSGATGQVRMIAETGKSDGTVQADISGGRYPTLMFRVVDKDNYIGVQLTEDVKSVDLYKIVAGVQTPLFDSAPGLFSSGAQTIKVVLDGSSIAVYLNGTYVCSVSETALQTATKVGFLGFDGGDSFDNYSMVAAKNYPAESTKPTLTSASVGTPANEVVLTWSEPMHPDISPASAFTVGNAGLGKSMAISAHTFVDATHTKLVVSPAFTSGDAGFMVSYTGPATHKMRDLVGNTANDIAGTTITNSVVTTVPMQMATKGANVIEGGDSSSWSYTSSSTAATCLSGGDMANPGGGKGIAADGFISCKVTKATGVAQNSGGIGLCQINHSTGYFDDQSGAKTGYWITFHSGVYSIPTTTYGTHTAPNGTVVAPAVNDLLRIRRVGTTVYGEVSKDDGSTWTVLQTWADAVTTKLLPQIGVSQNFFAGDTRSDAALV